MFNMKYLRSEFFIWLLCILFDCLFQNTCTNRSYYLLSFIIMNRDNVHLLEVRDHGPIDVDTCRKASKKDKIKKKVEVNFFEYTSPTKNKGSRGRRSSFIKKELSSLKALSTKTRLSLSRGSSTDTESSGSSQSDSGGCFA